MLVNKKVKTYFGTNEGEGDVPAKVREGRKTVIGVPWHSKNAKKGHFDQILREIPRGQKKFPCGQARFWQER